MRDYRYEKQQGNFYATDNSSNQEHQGGDRTLKEQILKGDVHTIDEMRAWLKPLGYSDMINEAAINFILREFVMSKVPSGSLSNVEMIVESLRPQLEVTTKDIEPIIIMGLYHHRNLIGSPSAFSLALSK